MEELELLGWDVLVIWQCQIKDADSLQKTIFDFMGYKNE